MKFCIKIILLGFALFTSCMVKAQVFTNDFENQNEWNYPWFNLHIIEDNSATNENYVCVCDSIHDYGLGFGIETNTLPKQSLNCRFGFIFKAIADTQADFVISIDDTVRNRYWTAYPLADFIDSTAEWSSFQIDFNIPLNYTKDTEIKGYIWNKASEILYFDDAQLIVDEMSMPAYLPNMEHKSETAFDPYELLSAQLIPIVEYIDAHGDTLSDPSVMETKFDDGWIAPSKGPLSPTIAKFVHTETTFKEDVKLLRLAFLMPLPEGNLTVYRRNQHIDTADFQHNYYLDREGFSIQNDSFGLSIYHNTGISSLQLNVDNHTACFNIDYWRDHPLLHYPLRTDTSDVFEDISYREVHKGETLKGEIRVFNSATEDLPRIMPVWDGYQSAFIFTEHADWTDLRTHRAVLFGNEHITKPEDAIGGFCFFGIPVTKSVFYWNPDKVTNEKTSKGRFSGLCASIKTDKEFYKLLKTIKKQGFEICLHSPEIYTTIPNEFPNAMRFMKQNFGTVSWIDHGYNNGLEKNREDMVCDGLLPESPYYAIDLWKKNGVRYLWNAYYEENRMEALNFDSHFVQPYDGFGDALPNRQITTSPNGDKDFLLWSTPSTLEVNEDYEWYYYFDSIRLQSLVDQHNVFITHIYPAWTDPWRGFWQYNNDSTAVAMPGFNFALSQLVRFRDAKKILPTTIETYLNYYEKLQNIEYLILDEKTTQLSNRNEAIKGLTLLCTKPIIVEGKAISFRKVEEGYLIWFDLGKHETLTIRHRE